MKRFLRAALSAAVAVGMISVVPGVVFAAQPSCGDTLMVNTKLTADLDCSGYGGDYALTLGKKGLTLNLGGHTLWGPVGDDSQDGVGVNGKKYSTVKNGTIANFDEGIDASGSVGSTYKNLTFTQNGNDVPYSAAIYLTGTGNTVDSNHMSGYYYGIETDGATHTWFTNNHITGGVYGIYTEYDSWDHFVNNYAEASYAEFDEEDGGSQTWTNNEANGKSAAEYGFYFDCSEYGSVWASGNEAYANVDYGFYIYECYDWANPTLNPSVISNNSAHNNAGDDAYGFYDDQSLYATYSNNTANHNEYFGFDLDGTGHGTFKGNVANHNGNDGIYVDVYGASNQFAAFANNTANYNGEYGIDGAYGVDNATGNTAHHNGTAPDDCWNLSCNGN